MAAQQLLELRVEVRVLARQPANAAKRGLERSWRTFNGGSRNEQERRPQMRQRVADRRAKIISGASDSESR